MTPEQQREAAAAKIAAEEKIASGKDDGFESQDESDEQDGGKSKRRKSKRRKSKRRKSKRRKSRK